MRLALLPLLLFSWPLTAQDFSFFDFWSMQAGQKFRILTAVAGKRLDVGEGQILKFTDSALSFRFAANVARFGVQGEVHIVHLRTGKKNVVLQVRFKGAYDGKEKATREIVQADAPLARLGILTFQYLNGERFLQISRNSFGENKLITDWGACTLAL